MYELPPTAGGDEGLEGFAFDVAGERAGRVAALNRTPDGLIVLVDTGVGIPAGAGAAPRADRDARPAGCG